MGAPAAFTDPGIASGMPVIQGGGLSPLMIRVLADALLDRLCAEHPLGYRPTLLWKASLRVSAGMAYYTHRAIGLSPHLLTTEERLIKTLIHEYAHLLAFQRHGRKGTGHGAHWKAAMIELGQQPEVRHRYTVTRNAKRQQVAYTCRKCGLLIRRHRRLPKRRKYIHDGCGGAIAFAGVHPLEPES